MPWMRLRNQALTAVSALLLAASAIVAASEESTKLRIVLLMLAAAMLLLLIVFVLVIREIRYTAEHLYQVTASFPPRRSALVGESLSRWAGWLTEHQTPVVAAVTVVLAVATLAIAVLAAIGLAAD